MSDQRGIFKIHEVIGTRASVGGALHEVNREVLHSHADDDDAPFNYGENDPEFEQVSRGAAQSFRQRKQAEGSISREYRAHN